MSFTSSPHYAKNAGLRLSRLVRKRDLLPWARRRDGMQSKTTPHRSPSDDPVMDAEVEHAIAPYRDLLPPEALEVIRATIIQAYQEHPMGRRILDHLREENRAINESDDIPIHQNASPAPQVAKLSASGIQRKRGQ